MGATLKGDLTKRMRRGEKRVVKARQDTAKDIRDGAAARSRVDTGAMQKGWQTAEVDDDTSQVGNAVEWVIYNELGTRHMSAQPMLYPAVEVARKPFVQRIRDAYKP